MSRIMLCLQLYHNVAMHRLCSRKFKTILEVLSCYFLLFSDDKKWALNRTELSASGQTVISLTSRV